MRLSLRYPAAARFFRQYAAAEPPVFQVPEVNEDDWQALMRSGFVRSAQMESSFLCAKCSDVLLPEQCCLIHAAAFRDREHAYLLAADPGVGKSTQVRTLQELYPGEFSVICGDRPALKLTDDGRVMVHMTPWNGKENWGGAPAAPLSDLIFLKRGESSSLRQLTVREAVLPLWSSLIHTAEMEEGIRQAAEFATGLLSRIRTWEFVNGGIPDSSKMLYEQLLRRE